MKEIITTALDLVALGLIVAGAWLIFMPAALIVLGFGVGLVSWRATR